MRKIKEYTPKRHYFILLNGRMVGESWAVSPEKARNNWWWRNIKNEDAYSPRDYDPEDFDVAEV